MPYETLNQANVSSASGIFIYVADVVPVFTPMLLFTLFIITLLGTYYSQKRLERGSSFLTSFAVAGYVTVVIAYSMMLIPGFINVLTLSVVTVVAIISTLLVLLHKE